MQFTRKAAQEPFVVLVIAALLGAGVSVWLTLVTPPSAQLLMGWVTGVAAALLVATSAVAAYALVRSRRTRAEAEVQHQKEIAELNANMAELTDRHIVTLARMLRLGHPLEAAVSEMPEHDGELGRLVSRMGDGLACAERRRRAGLDACGVAAGRIQSLTETLHGELKALANEVRDDGLMGKLFYLDNLTVQGTLMADRIAVLTGARSGRPWTKPITLENIVRGAMSRIAAYDRVRLHSTGSNAVFGYAARHVINVIAELLDNATKFSPPTDSVDVYIEEPGMGGVVVRIDDSGIGLGSHEREQADKAVAGELPLTDLTGARLGLAVVGMLAQKHGLTISYRPSARQGTTAIVTIPQELITQPRKLESSVGHTSVTTIPQVQGAAIGANAVSAVGAGSGSVNSGLSSTSASASSGVHGAASTNGSSASSSSKVGELPKRPRGKTLEANNSEDSSADNSPPRRTPSADANRTHPSEVLGSRFSAFRNGLESSDNSDQ